jgi:hypothetical protein
MNNESRGQDEPTSPDFEANLGKSTGRGAVRLLPVFVRQQYKRISKLLLALACLVVLGEAWLGEHLASRAHRMLMMLPAYDYVEESRVLHQKEHFDEALVVIDAGLEDDALDAAIQEQLRALRVQVEADRSGWVRRIRNAGYGALTGKANTPEGLAAALATDLFVVGDVRDLAIQGKNWVMDEDVDEFIVILSAVGIATTAAPYGDWLPALLKAARRAGALSKAFVRTFGHICTVALKTRDFSKVRAFGDALWSMARHSSSYQAMRLLRHIDDTTDAARLAGFMGRHPKHGAFALQVLDDDIIQQIARGSGRTALSVAEESFLVIMAKKGQTGQKAQYRYAYWLRVHPTVGLIKGAWKGTLQRYIVKSKDWLGADVALVGLVVIIGYGAVQVWWLRNGWRLVRGTGESRTPVIVR